MKWLALAGLVVALAGCRKDSKVKDVKIESNDYRMEVVQDYAGVTLYLDGDYSPPSAERRPTEDEFDAAHELITKHLNSVGEATENPDEYKGADFTLNRYFDPRAAINVVSDLHSPKVIDALISAQRELKGAFAINLDSHPAYVSVVPDGRVIGYASEGDRQAEGTKILQDYGFDTKSNGEQAAPSDGEKPAN